MKVSQTKIDKIIPYASNSRTHSDEQVAQIAASIKEFGFNNPVLLDGDNGIIAGHGRVLAARKLGMGEVPTIELAHLSENQRKAYIIADNKLALNAGWDMDLLSLEMGDLKNEGFDLSLIGFNEDELANIFIDKTEGLTDPDAVPDIPDDPVTKEGDVWLLGKHRLMCGDSTSSDSVAALWADDTPHLTITDPPYGIGYSYDKHDDSKSEDNAQLVEDVFALCTTSKVYTPGLMNLRREVNRYPEAKVAVWYKKFAAAGNGVGGASTWEPIIIESPMAKSLKNDVLQIMTDRVQVDGKSLRDLHSCPKPADLYKELMEAFSRAGDICYEPFSGSGTTIIAGEMTGRSIYAMELSPAYVDVAVKRWQDFTGEQAKLEATGEYFPLHQKNAA